MLHQTGPNLHANVAAPDDHNLQVGESGDIHPGRLLVIVQEEYDLSNPSMPDRR